MTPEWVGGELLTLGDDLLELGSLLKSIQSKSVEQVGPGVTQDLAGQLVAAIDKTCAVHDGPGSLHAAPPLSAASSPARPWVVGLAAIGTFLLRLLYGPLRRWMAPRRQRRRPAATQAAALGRQGSGVGRVARVRANPRRQRPAPPPPQRPCARPSIAAVDDLPVLGGGPARIRPEVDSAACIRDWWARLRDLKADGCPISAGGKDSAEVAAVRDLTARLNAAATRTMVHAAVVQADRAEVGKVHDGLVLLDRRAGKRRGGRLKSLFSPGQLGQLALEWTAPDSAEVTADG